MIACGTNAVEVRRRTVKVSLKLNTEARLSPFVAGEYIRGEKR